MTLIKKYKKYLRTLSLIWLACMAIFVLAYFLVMSPQYKTMSVVELELAENQQLYSSAQQAAQEDTKAMMNRQIEDLQNKLGSFVLDFSSAADLTFDISRIATESKVSSFNIQSDDVRSASSSAEPNNIFEKHIKVSFVAGFHEFAVFLNSLERHQPFLFVSQFTLGMQNSDKASYQVSLDIAALVRKPQDVKAKDETAGLIVGAKL
jgi:Tfp pilus assembly protein PilO